MVERLQADVKSEPGRSRVPDSPVSPGGVSAREAAALLGISERSIRRAIRRGDLVGTKLGRAYQIGIDALDRYRQQHFAARNHRRIPVDASAKTQSAMPALIALPRPEQTRLDILPIPLTRFIGRERQIAEVVDLLRRDDVRLVTLTGPGGVGKTRLALRVGEELRNDFSGGVAVVSLAAVRRPDLVLPTIALALGVRGGEDRPVQDRLVTFLENREILIILDNFEQIIDASPVLAEILLRCPRLRTMVTSRAPLHLSGERLFEVPPLALPLRSSDRESHRVPNPRELWHVEAVQLFVDRAQAMTADFALTPENVASVAAICERTDGLPLAIELAAARTRSLSTTDLLARMSHQLPVLTGGPRDQPARLRTMANAIDWSHELLSLHERALFRRLAVFVGGFSVRAVEQVAGQQSSTPVPDARCATAATPITLDLLAALVNMSLMQRGAGPGGDTRYTMLEPIRQFGLDKLAASGEGARIRDAHAAWCIDFAEQANPELSRPDQTVWFDRLEAEHPNMRAALAWLLEQKDAERGLRLAGALSWFWSSRGYLREALGWFETFLALPFGGNAFVRAIAAREAANIAQWQGMLDRAAAYSEESLSIFRGLGDPLEIAVALRGMGSIAIDRGALEEASAFLDESWEMLRELGTAWDVAFAMYLAGRLAFARGNVADAADRFVDAATAFRSVGDRAYVATALGRQAAAAFQLGHHGAAKAAYAESLAIARELNEHSWVVWALAGAARIALAERRPETAARLLGASSAIRETTGAQSLEGEDELRTSIRSALAAARFETMWKQGMTLARDRAIADAMSVFGFDHPSRRSPIQGPDALTPRERDVLRLLVDGLSDKEIAAALGITRYTASNHVTAIRAKLGVPSRAAAAALAVRRDLV